VVAVRHSFLVLLVLTTLYSHNVSAMTVEEAYAAIPHHRTVFEPGASRLSRPQIDSLKLLFLLSDRATVLRVEGMRAFRDGRSEELRRIMESYRVVIASLKDLKATSEVTPIQALVLDAVQDHQRFFRTKLDDPRMVARRDLSFTADIQQASQKLHRAHDLLMQTFPNEPNVNKAAFYDYLCALDFL
jgi:hypothetical protein